MEHIFVYKLTSEDSHNPEDKMAVWEYDRSLLQGLLRNPNIHITDCREDSIEFSTTDEDVIAEFGFWNGDYPDDCE